MTEPTLLQRARSQLDNAVTWGTSREGEHLRAAIGLVLQHLEQQQTAMSGPAQVRGVVKCKECGLHRQHWVHDLTRVGYSDPEHPELESHDFDPETLADRVAALEAMSESHTHNIASLFIDFDALPKPKPAQVPGEPRTVDMHKFTLRPGQNVRLPDGRFVQNMSNTVIWLDVDHGAARAGVDAPAAPAGDIDLDELQRLCDALQPGAWSPSSHFIAAARDALPKLIAKVRELDGHLEAARPIVALHKLRTGQFATVGNADREEPEHG